MDGCWREGDERKGYFSELDNGVQLELKKTRAEALIAKNRREAALEASKLADMTGVRGVMADMARTVKSSRALQRSVEGLAVAGWVRTISESVQSALISAASDSDASIPTLEEIDTIVETSASSSGVSRKVEYDLRRAAVVERYESSTHDPYELQESLDALDIEFSDLRYGDGPAVVVRQQRKWECIRDCSSIPEEAKLLLDDVFSLQI